jgi:hypothetical protein
MFAGKTVAEYSDDEKRNQLFKSIKVANSGEALDYPARRWCYLGEITRFDFGFRMLDCGSDYVIFALVGVFRQTCVSNNFISNLVRDLISD